MTKANDLGYSLIECLFAVGLATTIGGISMAHVLAGLDEFRTVSAVRFVSARLQRTRMDAVSRRANTAVRFSPEGRSYRFGIYEDGNGDGVRSRDIEDGIDRAVEPDDRLSRQFPGVDFGALPGVPAVEGSAEPPGIDPVRLGSSDMAVFTPLGTSTPGSLYVLGPNDSQYVVRLYGETGKTRILRLNRRTYEWEPL